MDETEPKNVVPFRRPAPAGPPPPTMDLSDTVVFNSAGTWIRPSREEDKLYVFPEGQLPIRWRNGVEIEPGTPLRVVFDFLRSLSTRDKMLVDALTFSNTEPFLDEAAKPFTEEKDPAEGLRALVVTHYTSYMKYGKKKRVRINQSIDVSGIASDTQDNYAIDFLPVNTMVDLPIYLARKGVFWSTEQDEQEAYDFNLSLGEFLEALLDEICFHGAPSSRDASLGDLKKTMAEIESGEMKTIPWEEVKQELGIKDEDDE